MNWLWVIPPIGYVAVVRASRRQGAVARLAAVCLYAAFLLCVLQPNGSPVPSWTLLGRTAVLLAPLCLAHWLALRRLGVSISDLAPDWSSVAVEVLLSPCAEEVAFRHAPAALGVPGAWASAALFSAAHAHDLPWRPESAPGVAVQCGFTFVFGLWVGAGHLRTYAHSPLGALASACAVHTMCNAVGFPRVDILAGSEFVFVVASMAGAGAFLYYL